MYVIWISHVGRAKKYNSKTLSLLDPKRPSIAVSKTKSKLKGDLNGGNWSSVRSSTWWVRAWYTIPQLGNAYVRRRQIMVLQQHFFLVSFERTKNDSWHIKVTAGLMYSRTKSHLYFVIATCSNWGSINAVTCYWRKDKTKATANAHRKHR